jgi:undecaprenyl-phosphate 4-deoxy-4-formamido-L-arabinose transferase
MVNDCSPDDVWNTIKNLAAKHKCIIGINLAKNFGQHAALMAGYARCSGDVVVSLDDDGQAPIDELYKLIEELDRGYDVVYAYYNEIKQSRFRKFGTKIATDMSRALLGAPKGFKGSSFYIARKFIIDEIIKYDNAYPYLLGLILRTTRKISYVSTTQREREVGKSGYTVRSLLYLWMNGFTAFSVKPLEVSVWVGIIFAVLGVIGAVITIIHKICNPGVLVGWSSLVSINLIIGGVVLLILGMIGEYIGRIYICINKAPQYVVREEIRQPDATFRNLDTEMMENEQHDGM